VIRVSVERLRRLIKEEIEDHPKIMTLAQVKQQFPDAYKYLLNGDMQDLNGRDIKTPKHLQHYMDACDSYFFIDGTGQLHMKDAYEHEVWDPEKKMFWWPQA